MVHGEPALAHHPFEVTVRELVSAIPPDAQKEHRRLEVSPLERGLMLLQERYSERMIDELKWRL